MESVKNLKSDGLVFIKEFPKRYYIASQTIVHNEMELSYEVMRLENCISKVEKYIPIYATSRYAGLISKVEIEKKTFDTEFIILVDNEFKNYENSNNISEGKYCCLRSNDSFWARENTVNKLQEYAKENGFEIIGDIIEMVIIDYTITDREEERLYEYQVKVEIK